MKYEPVYKCKNCGAIFKQTDHSVKELDIETEMALVGTHSANQQIHFCNYEKTKVGIAEIIFYEKEKEVNTLDIGLEGIRF